MTDRKLTYMNVRMNWESLHTHLMSRLLRKVSTRHVIGELCTRDEGSYLRSQKYRFPYKKSESRGQNEEVTGRIWTVSYFCLSG